ncbi:MAG TPA: Lrp/AsnC family transcriptional regulator [Acidimicrobiales bacterium]|nr:Lrp/AsnC family transcriptional regulator [Acidimicrobiales bacterium]
MDRRLLEALAAAPRSGILALARRARVARNTAQAHLDKLIKTGVIVGFGPEVDLRKVGYAVSAFVSLEIAQGRGGPVDEHLRAIPEIVEAWMTTGTSDLLCRVVARDNDHLGHVINQILEVPGVTRTTTALLLTTRILPRSLHLVIDVDKPTTLD